MTAPAARTRGFTLIELVVTLTLVSVLALVAVPLYEVAVTHAKESELRATLREIRNAIDAYKAASDAGYISKGMGETGYPASLQLLVDGVDTVAAPVNGAGGLGAGGPGAIGATPLPGASATSGSNIGGNNNASTLPAHMVFLRRVPRDPFFADQSVPPEQQWNLRAYGALPGDFGPGDDVYDVTSKSTAIGLNGIAYKDW